MSENFRKWAIFGTHRCRRSLAIAGQAMPECMTPSEFIFLDGVSTLRMGREGKPVCAGSKCNFLEIGGQFCAHYPGISRIRRQFKVELGLQGMFESPAVSGLTRQWLSYKIY